MKLNCHKCSCDLGEMVKGKIRNGAVLLCKDCIKGYMDELGRLKVLDDLRVYEKGVGGGSNSYPPGFEDLFKGLGNKK